MNVSQPVASTIGSVNFGFLSTDEIRALSVKRIVNPETYDSLLHPVIGGLYDPALGASGSNMYDIKTLERRFILILVTVVRHVTQTLIRVQDTLAT